MASPQLLQHQVSPSHNQTLFTEAGIMDFEEARNYLQRATNHYCDLVMKYNLSGSKNVADIVTSTADTLWSHGIKLTEQQRPLKTPSDSSDYQSLGEPIDCEPTVHDFAERTESPRREQDEQPNSIIKAWVENIQKEALQTPSRMTKKTANRATKSKGSTSMKEEAITRPRRPTRPKPAPHRVSKSSIREQGRRQSRRIQKLKPSD